MRSTSRRPIPSGRVSRNAALYLSLLLFGLGIALAYTINSICFAIAIPNSLMLIVYARNLKRTALAGNISVGYLTDSAFLYGGVLFGIPGLVQASGLFALAMLAMLATIAREIAKDIEDIDGDSAMGLDTLPIRIGSRRAGYAASAFGMVAVLLSPVPYLSLGFSVWYLAVVMFADLCFPIAIM